MANRRRITSLQDGMEAWKYEENSAKKIRLDETYPSLLNQAKEMFKEAAQWKQESDSKKRDSELERLRSAACVLFTKLRRLNRLQKLQTHSERTAVQVKREQVDVRQRELNNAKEELALMEKETHLSKQTTGAKVDLAPLNVFYENVPISIYDRNSCEDDHVLYVARLCWELEERKKLALRVKDMEQDKTKILKDIDELKKVIDNFNKNCAASVESFKPLLETCKSNISALSASASDSALKLPKCLFLLYRQILAYSITWDKSICTFIASDKNPASSRANLFIKHPYSVYVTMKFPGGFVLKLEFCYLEALELVTVIPKLTITKSSLAVAGKYPMLSNACLLNCLIPGDDGRSPPNFVCRHLMEVCQVSTVDEINEEFGIPYIWVQLICGIECSGKNVDVASKVSYLTLYLHNQEELDDDDDIIIEEPEIISLPSTSTQQNSQTPNASGTEIDPSTPSALKRLFYLIRMRMATLIPLQEQLDLLATGVVNVPASVVNKFPPVIESQLVSFVPIADDQLKEDSLFRYYLEHNLVPRNLQFYSATIKNSHGKLIAQVGIHPDYPLVPPYFILHMFEKKAVTDALNNADLREMETELNLYWPELVNIKTDNRIEKQSIFNNLLSSLMQRLLMMFDVLDPATVNSASVLSCTKNKSRVRGLHYVPYERCFIRRSGRALNIPSIGV